MSEFRTCQGDWPGVAAHSRRACHDVATVEVSGRWLCLAHATRNLDEVLAFFDPGPRARSCGDSERADTYDRAQQELRGLREAIRSTPPRAEVDVDAVLKAVYPVWCATTPRESWSDMEYILRAALSAATKTGGV